MTNGVKFDSSRDGNQPFVFELGIGQMINGWDEGVAKLRVGDHAILVIPSNLAYGSKGDGDCIAHHLPSDRRRKYWGLQTFDSRLPVGTDKPEIRFSVTPA